MATWGTGVTKQKGSPRRNSTVPGRVKRQFMVKVKGSHSVSTSPSSGVNPSLHMLGEPRHHSAPVGIGAEHVARHERSDAGAEMRLDQGRAARRLPGLDDADVERGAAARPGEGHFVRA